MDKLKSWENIHDSILKYIDEIVEISDKNGYRLRPKMRDDGEIYDWVDTTKFKSVEELNKWEEETGFECDMCEATKKIENNEQIYAFFNIHTHFNIDLRKNFEVRQKVYSLHIKTRELETSIKKIIKTNVDMIFEEIRPNGSLFVIKSEKRPLYVNEKKQLYDNYIDIVEEFQDEEFNHCYRVKT